MDITEAGFEVVVDGMIEKEFPASLNGSKVLTTGLSSTQLTDHAYKAADFLMMPLLQNQLLDNLIENILGNRVWRVNRLTDLCSLGLRQGPYYQSVIDSTVYGLMHETEWTQSLGEQLNYLLECPDTLKHVIEVVARWAESPWEIIDKTNISNYRLPIIEQEPSA